MKPSGAPVPPAPSAVQARLSLVDVLSQPLGRSIHDLDFEPDLLGDGYTRTTIELGSDPDHETPGAPVVCTLVRHLPAGVDDADFAARPAMLLVHGMTDFFFQTHVAEHFHALGYAVYGIDLRKCGRSHRPGQTWHHVTSQSIYDEDLTVALSLLAAGHGSVVPVGHSTGGLDVTMWIARLHAATRRGDAARGALYATVDAVVLNSPWLGLQFDAFTNIVIRHVFPQVAKIVPKWHVPGGINPTYGRTIHVEEHGEWDFDRTFKPLLPRPKQISWLVGVSREIDKLHSGFWSTGVPTLLLCSDADSPGRSVRGPDGSEVPEPEAFITDTILRPSQMRDAAHLVDPDCTVVTLPGAMHDVFLSRAEVRDAAFAAVDEFLAV
ncbi:alpha/beta hydrolase [Corynebacterium terpenotabidum]|uniref:AB hydrolase-1 domain-containing protein n=1 Tax=Corynebacterium terpenotabidum Y-11 TaxID=1200352 RepID=S4XH42_9CORY|nr:alpha/beta hydrolase [Corynebacterium terpenotabidum]AGP30975.1 hypothetical protein A606_06640 [Corynebacterium terpenotabidum Y-11]